MEDEIFNWVEATCLDTTAIYWSLNVPDLQSKIPYDSAKVKFLREHEAPEYMIPFDYSNDTLYTFYRFFGNGKVYTSSTDHFPIIEEQKTFDQGLIGYYKFKNAKELSLEIFFPQNFGVYKTYWGEIHSDTLLISSNPYSGFFSEYDRSNFEEYFKRTGSGIYLYSVPDW